MKIYFVVWVSDDLTCYILNVSSSLSDWLFESIKPRAKLVNERVGHDTGNDFFIAKSEIFFHSSIKVLKYQIYDAHMRWLEAVINCQFLHLYLMYSWDVLWHFLMTFLPNWFSSFHFILLLFHDFLIIGTKLN